MTPVARVLHRPEDVTREWLEHALGRRVQGLERIEEPGTWSTHVRLRARLDGEEAPLPLRVKLASVRTFGRDEVDYYGRLFAGLAGAPLVRCHHAAADDTHYHLLLDDLAGSHRNQFEVEPTERYGRALVEAAATLHAHLWPQPPPDAAALGRSLATARAGIGAMLDAMREGFTADERDEAAALFERLPAELESRRSDPRGFTWVHGDLNPGNVLAPVAGDGPLVLIDHQPFANASLTRWLGVWDLALAIVVWWPVASRRAWERGLIAHWHAALASRGVTDYPLERAWEDWRLCARQCLAVPADGCAGAGAAGAMRWLWEPQLRRVLAAARDHG